MCEPVNGKTNLHRSVLQRDQAIVEAEQANRKTGEATDEGGDRGPVGAD